MPGAVGVSAVLRAVVDNSSVHVAVTRATAKDPRRVPERVIRSPALANGVVGPTGAPVRCHVGSAGRRAPETACRRMSARVNQLNIKSASTPAASVSILLLDRIFGIKFLTMNLLFF